MEKYVELSQMNTRSSTLMTLGWIITACFVSLKILNELRKVYCFTGLFRSPVYDWIKGKYLVSIEEMKSHRVIDEKIINLSSDLMSNFYFLEIQEEKKGNITTSLLTFGNQLRIIVFNFIVPLVLIVFLKYMIIQDEFELAHVSFYVILWKFFHIFVLIIFCFSC